MKKLVLVALFGIGVAFGADSIEVLTQKCEANDGKACFSAGAQYDFGDEGVAKDASLAVKYYEKGCNLNNGSACNNLASIYNNGKGVAKNSSKANELHIKACDKLNYASACSSAGAAHFQQGRYLSAKKSWEKGCNSDSGVSGSCCSNLGTLYAIGRGVKTNFNTAKKYFKMGCDKGFKSACKSMRKIR